MQPPNVERASEWTPERISALVRAVAAMIAGGIVLGLFASRVNAYYIAAAIGAAMLVVMVAWQFELAVVLFILTAFITLGRTPDIAEGLSGEGRGLYLSELMLGFLLAVWVGRYVLRALPERRIPSGFYAPAAVYLAYCALSTVNGMIFWDHHVDQSHQHIAVNIIEIGFRVLSVGALVMVATTFHTRKWLRIATIATLIPTAYNVVGTNLPVKVPWTVYGGSLMSLFPVCFACAVALDPSRSRRARLAGVLVVGLGIFTSFVKGITWASGWLGLFVGLGVVMLLVNRRVFVVAALVGCVMVFGSAAYRAHVHEKVVAESEQSGDYDRFDLMRGAWKYATTFPLGVGLGNYRSYNTYHYGELWGTTSYTFAHGTYSQCLAETGIPGLVLFVAVLACGLRWMLRSLPRVKDPFSRNTLLAAIAHLIGISLAATVGDYIIPAYYNAGVAAFSWTVYSWIIWGLAIAHVRLGIQSETTEEQEAHDD